MFHSNGCGCGCHGMHGGMCNVMMCVKVLLVVGGLNWGLVGLGMLTGSDWNVLHMVLGSVMMLEAIVYLLVGVAAGMKIFGCRCKVCSGGMCASCEVPHKGGEGMNNSQM